MRNSSALYAKLAQGGIPYVCFGVWTPYNNRVQVERTFSAWVCVGHAWALRRLTGPESFDQWLPGFRVWRYAMRCVKGAKTGALDAYAEHIQALSAQCPE